MADDFAWDADSIDAPAGQDFEILVDNQDDGVQHNLDVKGGPGELKTPLEAGPVIQRLTVNLPAGDYDYVCDLHEAMTGTLRVS